MRDFIAQSKLPGVIIAKALMNRFNMDTLIAHDAELKNKLKEIGYLINLKAETKTALTESLQQELQQAKKVKADAEYKAEVFSKVLTEIFKKMSHISKFDTELIYMLSQIIFIWDEFIDFSDFQKAKNDVNKVRESIFYRAATMVMKEMEEKEVKALEHYEIKTHQFEIALNKLQILNSQYRFNPEQVPLVITTIQNIGFTKPEMVFFLLTIESVLFIQVAEQLLTTVSNTQANLWRTIQKVDEGIELAKSMFHFTEDKLEEKLAMEAETIMLKLTVDIFS